MRYSRNEVRARLCAQIDGGRPIIGAGAGTGISAKFAEAGGADLIIIYNSGRFRMAGHGSLAGLLAFGDANAVVQEMGERDILPVVRSTPVIAGVMGTDPMRQIGVLLRKLDALGFSGINNFPTVGLVDGRLRMELERTELGFGKEIAHMGLTVGGSIGLAHDDAMPLEAAPALVQTIGDAAWRVNSDLVLLCHGGPIATPEDAAYVMERCDAVGFVGASSMERLPVETAITTTIREFKAIPVTKNGR
ncbi:MAG: hypothetical protein K0Q89_363 [Thermomicrobiales bacterium]|nr:hypothetical protein [Thermomicrobiales bacterium]